MKACVIQCDEVSNPCGNREVCKEGMCQVSNKTKDLELEVVLPLVFCLPIVVILCCWRCILPYFRRRNDEDGQLEEGEFKGYASLPRPGEKPPPVVDLPARIGSFITRADSSVSISRGRPVQEGFACHTV